MKRINGKAILYIIGKFLLIEAGALLLCLIASVYYNESIAPLLQSALITGGTGFILTYILKKSNKEIGKREGYIIVSTVWIFFSLFGSLPFILSGSIPDFTNAFFETMSGLTTTGASILTDIESLPKGILLWRSMSQWLGGMGIIVLSLAILPILGIGGMQLYTAEVPGPTKDKIHPKVKDTAQRLYMIYLLFTVAETILLIYGDMSVFDALNHAFTTMSSGGFSTFNSSIVETSPYIQYIIILFMFFAGVNFTLSYFAVHANFKKVWSNEEFRKYLTIIFLFTITITGTIILQKFQLQSLTANISSFEKIFRDSLFQVVSISTTTGYVSADYLAWSPIAIMSLYILMFFGASAGSTSGGIKIVRIILLAKHSYYEFKRLVHPNAIIPLRLDKRTVPEKIITNVLAYIIIYIIIYLFGVVVMSGLGYNLETSLGSVVATLSNVGPGIGNVGPMDNYAFLSSPAKWFLTFMMLCGRLELFTVLILFSPAFWKK
ncbi:MAG: TrkH family potassium uptake protein [Bacteroidales bacterium]|jgi:trk system potassium uptake protein TrkH|nr:TrkH family potassium uptake protein [Bacteroidales bacterium]